MFQIYLTGIILTFQDGNCAVISDLSFCDNVAYNVPSNPNKFPNSTALGQFYDNYARTQFEFFEKVLSTVACETTSSAQYSLARTCEDCSAAYKQWLCAVAIPRCTDFSAPDQPYLFPRAMGQPKPDGTFLAKDILEIANQSAFLNNSRNSWIDSHITPGPYKELLPCEDLCYHVVQSCPASMSLGCPTPGSISFNQSYGQVTVTGTAPNGNATPVSCNYPGEALFAAGSLVMPPSVFMVSSVVVIGLMFI